MSRKLYIMIVIQVMLIENVFAYLDPGTMSYMLQVLMMAFIGGIVAIKTFWQNIKSFFSRIFNK